MSGSEEQIPCVERSRVPTWVEDGRVNVRAGCHLDVRAGWHSDVSAVKNRHLVWNAAEYPPE